MTHDTWHLTHDRWNMTYGTWHIIQRNMTHKPWHMAHDTRHMARIWRQWHMSHDICHIIHDTWHMTHNIRHMTQEHEAWGMTHNTWHMTQDTWHMTWKCLRLKMPAFVKCQHSWTACLRSRNACTPDLLEMLARSGANCALEMPALLVCLKCGPKAIKCRSRKCRSGLFDPVPALSWHAGALSCPESVARRASKNCLRPAQELMKRKRPKIINFLGKMERGNRDRHKIWAW
jgi:hypothetical protein